MLYVTPQEIRFWETEFPQIRPQKTHSGKRLYRREDVVLLAAVKHLLNEKKFTLAGAQRIIAQSEELLATPVRTNEFESKTEEHAVLEQSLEQNERDDAEVLQEAARMLDEEDEEFDEMTHKIYQQCADEIMQAKMEIEPSHVGEMMKDAIVQKELRDKNSKRLSRLDYEKALATLIQSKNSLSELLVMLEKYRESNFFEGFKA